MKQVTAKEYRQKYQGQEAYIDTGWGRQRISGIDPQYWAHCPEMNGGFGQSFSLHTKSIVLVKTS